MSRHSTIVSSHSAAPASAEPVIEAVGVTRRVGERTILDGVSLQVSRGEVFGLIGRNGAGKTTLVECVVGLQKPDSGAVRTLGVDPARDRMAFTRRVSIQAQSGSLLPTATVRETLDLFASFYPSTRYVSDLLAGLGLERVAGDRVGRLSGGEARRLQIAVALLPFAELVVLDEPSAAVDPSGRATIEAVIRSLASDGVTVLLTTHDMTEAERWCDRVAVLDRASLIACGTPTDLIEQHRGGAMVRFSADRDIDLDAVRRAAHGDTVSVDSSSSAVRVQIDTADVDGLVRRLTFASGVRMIGLTIERRGLAELYFD